MPLRRFSANVLLLALLCAAVSAQPARPLRAATPSKHSGAVPTSEFSSLVREFSEEGGYFLSDNFTSNETSYLHVVKRLRELRVSGGAYIGVGPEQNFTYIAKIRPRIAFIIDIRRQAMIQHLLYKAVFHRAESRAQFLSILLSRPLTGRRAPSRTTPLNELVEYFRRAPAPDEVFAANLAHITQQIRQEFQLPLTHEEMDQLEYVYTAFRNEGLAISFRFGGRHGRASAGWFPNLAELVLQPDPDGQPGNFLASDEDYRAVRRLHLQNRIIPLVGDFAGPKALPSVAGYLRKNAYTLSAFYTSNVEQYLFQGEMFERFANNVRKLPRNHKSVFIRAIARMGMDHPAHVPGHGTTTLLQKMSVFFADLEARTYGGYWDLVTTHYIAGNR